MAKSVNQMSLEELKEQEAYYANRTDHVAKLMLVRIREAIKAKESK